MGARLRHATRRPPIDPAQLASATTAARLWRRAEFWRPNPVTQFRAGFDQAVWPQS